MTCIRLAEHGRTDAEELGIKLGRGHALGAVQAAVRLGALSWDGLEPVADGNALDAAKRLSLGSDPAELRRLTDGKLPQLVAALVRPKLGDDCDAIRKAARG